MKVFGEYVLNDAGVKTVFWVCLFVPDMHLRPPFTWEWVRAHDGLPCCCEEIMGTPVEATPEYLGCPYATLLSALKFATGKRIYVAD